MSEANKALFRRWFDEVWNQGREDTIDELFAATAIAHGIGENEQPLTGPSQFKPFVRNMRGAIPDIHIAIEQLVAEGDWVSCRVSLTGTHSGPGLGVNPTGGAIKIGGIVLARIQNGQIVGGWNSWDQLGLLRQIGALPSPTRDRFVTAS
jgi:predicted ester cyclase